MANPEYHGTAGNGTIDQDALGLPANSNFFGGTGNDTIRISRGTPIGEQGDAWGGHDGWGGFDRSYRDRTRYYDTIVPRADGKRAIFKAGAELKRPSPRRKN